MKDIAEQSKLILESWNLHNLIKDVDILNDVKLAIEEAYLFGREEGVLLSQDEIKIEASCGKK